MDGLKVICNEIKKRVRRNNDEVIAIEGYEGIGKTALGVIIGKEISPSFDMRKNIAYLPSFRKIEGKFNSIDKYDVLVLDEVIKILYKMRALERLQKEVVEFYATERKQCKVTIMCIPRFIDLNENFRNHRVRTRVWIPFRGYAIAYTRDGDKDIQDPWHVRNSLEIKKRLLGKKITDREVNEIIEAERKTINYLCDFRFPDLTTDEWKLYMDIYAEEKAKYAAEKLDEVSLEGTRAELYRNALVNLIKDARENHSLQELSDKTGLTMASISKMAREKINI